MGFKSVADDLGVGMSTLNKWIPAHRDTDVVSAENLSLAQENYRLRRENRILRKRGRSEKRNAALRKPKAMRFRFTEEHGGLSKRRVFARSWMSVHVVYVHSATARPVADSGLIWSRWHTSKNSRLSLGSYDRPRKTEELKEIGLDVGHRRVGRLMRRNRISVVRTRVKLIAQSCVARATLSGKSRRFESASLSSTARAILACLSQTR